MSSAIKQENTALAGQANQLAMNAQNNQTSIANTTATNLSREAMNKASLANNLQVSNNQIANQLAMNTADNATKTQVAQANIAGQQQITAANNQGALTRAQLAAANQIQDTQLKLAAAATQQAKHDQAVAAQAAAHDAITQAISDSTNRNNLNLQYLRNQGVSQSSNQTLLMNLGNRAAANRFNYLQGFDTGPRSVAGIVGSMGLYMDRYGNLSTGAPGFNTNNNNNGLP